MFPSFFPLSLRFLHRDEVEGFYEASMEYKLTARSERKELSMVAVVRNEVIACAVTSNRLLLLLSDHSQYLLLQSPLLLLSMVCLHPLFSFHPPYHHHYYHHQCQDKAGHHVLSLLRMRHAHCESHSACIMAIHPLPSSRYVLINTPSTTTTSTTTTTTTTTTASVDVTPDFWGEAVV